MIGHLSPREIVDASDGALSARRRRHLGSCASCRQHVEAFRDAVRSAASAGDVPEPAPSFWTAFEDRVGRATGQTVEPAAAWHVWSWRSVVLVAPAVLTLLVVGTLARLGRMPIETLPTTVRPTVAVPAGEAMAPVVLSEPAWSEVVDMTAGVSAEELPLVLPVRVGTAESVVEDLSRAERVELLRLIEEAIGGAS